MFVLEKPEDQKVVVKLREQYDGSIAMYVGGWIVAVLQQDGTLDIIGGMTPGELDGLQIAEDGGIVTRRDV